MPLLSSIAVVVVLVGVSYIADTASGECGMISETTQRACRFFKNDHGMVLWTAGQRIDMSTDSPYIWRVTSTNTYSDTMSVMKYTNWGRQQPNDYHKKFTEGCVAISSDKSCDWGDYTCDRFFCSVCEIDMV